MKKILLLTFIGSLFVVGNAMAHCGACEPHSHEDAAKVSCCSDSGKCCKEAKADCEGKKCCSDTGKCCKEGKSDCEGTVACCSDTGKCCKSKEACEDKGDETAAAPTAAPCCPKA